MLNRDASKRAGWLLGVTLLSSACNSNAPRRELDPLVGAWHSSVHFDSGPFASLTDLEFLYVFNSGGTMTESSNYDGAPPVAPAYGAWDRVGPNEFIASYEFFVTKAPVRIDELANGGGWLPDGRGRFDERIQLAADGASFESTIRYTPLKSDGSAAGEAVHGRARAVRILPRHD